jgi:hypothetical protein
MKHVKLGIHDTRGRDNYQNKDFGFCSCMCNVESTYLKMLRLTLHMLNSWLSVDFNKFIRNLSYNRLKFNVCSDG